MSYQSFLFELNLSSINELMPVFLFDTAQRIVRPLSGVFQVAEFPLFSLAQIA